MTMTTAELENLKKVIRKPYFLNRNYLASEKSGFPYFRYRILRPLLKLNYKTYKQLNPHTPWTSPASIELFEHWLKKDMIGFEWGSGSSTRYFSRKLKKLVSVEHNKEWYEKVSSMVAQENLPNVTLEYVKIDYPDPHLDKDGYQPAFNSAQIKAYENYYSIIDGYPDEYFDFIMVDGRARVKCGEHAIPKLKPGGMLVLDNSERPRYAPLKEKLADWLSIHTTTGLTDTTIWFKP